MKLISYLVVFLIQILSTKSQNSNTCTLLGTDYSKPFPSLLQCYVYNDASCCVSIHDDVINKKVTKLFSASCIRRYKSLLNLFCFGCNPSQYNYTDTVQKTVRLCDTFVQDLWGSPNFNQTSTLYDNCGMNAEGFSNYNKGLNSYIIPSLTYNNVYDFINSIGIPFFENYQIMIINTTIDSNCFTGSSFMMKFRILVNFLFFILFLF